MLAKDQLIAVAVAAAKRYELQSTLVCAMVERESTWNPWQIRYEAAFYKKYVLPAFVLNKFGPTEAQARAISWGLMQVMGEDAREFGFTEDLPSLCDPEIGTEIGCKIFAHKLAVAGGDVQKALLSWNGGANPNYPSEVRALEAHYLPPSTPPKAISA